MESYWGFSLGYNLTRIALSNYLWLLWGRKNSSKQGVVVVNMVERMKESMGFRRQIHRAWCGLFAGVVKRSSQG